MLKHLPYRGDLTDVNRRYIWLHLLHLTQTEWFPLDNLYKILHGGQRMARIQKSLETLPKILTKHEIGKLK